MSQKIFIDGEAGTTGLQIRERLADRSDLELLKIPNEKRKDIATREELLNEADIAILCLPDEAARQSVSLITNSNTRVIDASSAFRVHGDWAYGFPEMHKDQSKNIAQAMRVSNPGCYPQGPIVQLAPLIRAGLIPVDMPISVNAISGYSGGGRQMIEKYLEMGETAPQYSPYGLDFNHKHLPEMSHYCALTLEPVFQPAVGNYAQGMMSMIPLQLSNLANTPTGKDLHQAIGEHLATINNGYVELMPYDSGHQLGDLDPQMLNDTNIMQLYVFANDQRAQALLVAIYDNLGKGASGAAVQNLDLMITKQH